MIKSLTKDSNYVGIVSATLCVVHCILTPFLVVLVSKYEWWGNLTFVFLTIGLGAVIAATRDKPPAHILILIWGGYFLLTLFVILEGYWSLAEPLSYVASLILVMGHILNIRYCKKCAM